MSKNIGVILSGCGFLDGAEIRESVLTLLALDRAGVNVTIMAPNKDQHHVVDHLKGQEGSGERNILEEAARIARGQIKSLEDVDPKSLDALIIPGGYGVAKNLCTFAFDGSKAKVALPVKEMIEKVHAQGKPIGAICIAPALMALLFGSKGIKLTIGNDKETAAEIEKTGAKHESKEVHEICIDEKLKVVSTPAYMYGDAKLDKIEQGISQCVNKVLELSK